MSNFQAGDFIRLKKTNLYRIDRVYGGAVNIFEIVNLNSKDVEIQSCKQRIPRSEIEAIPINGKDDLQIYYDPQLTANYVTIGQPLQGKVRDRTYYLTTFKNCIYQGETYYDIIKKQNLKHVHEIQNFLRKKFQRSELRIDAV